MDIVNKNKIKKMITILNTLKQEIMNNHISLFHIQKRIIKKENILFYSIIINCIFILIFTMALFYLFWKSRKYILLETPSKSDLPLKAY